MDRSLSNVGGDLTVLVCAATHPASAHPRGSTAFSHLDVADALKIVIASCLREPREAQLQRESTTASAQPARTRSVHLRSLSGAQFFDEFRCGTTTKNTATNRESEPVPDRAYIADGEFQAQRHNGTEQALALIPLAMSLSNSMTPSIDSDPQRNSIRIDTSTFIRCLGLSIPREIPSQEKPHDDSEPYSPTDSTSSRTSENEYSHDFQ